jgi:outer membrane protein assembly factor BamD (BamD/ComL family)
MKSKVILLLTSLVLGALLISGAQAQLVPKISTGADRINDDLSAVSNLLRMGEMARAIALLDHLKITYGDDSRIRAYYKLAYKENKQYPELEKIIRDDLSNDSQNPYLITELGEARFLQNDQAGADSLWNLALRFGRLDENSYRLVADNMMRYGLYESAIEIFLKGRESLSRPTAFAPELANLYETQRDYSKAIGEYITQVLFDPSQLGFITIKIRGYLEDTDKPEQIIEAVSEKIKETPNHTELYEILGDLYIKQNEMNKALECYRTISAKQNDDGQALVKFAARAYDSRAYGTAINAVDDYLKATQKGIFKEIGLSIKAKSQLNSGLIDQALTGFEALTGAADFHIRDEAGYMRGLIYAQNKNDCDSALLVWDNMQKNAQDLNLQGRAWLEMAVCNLKKDNLIVSEDLLKQVTSGKLPDSSMEKAAFLLSELTFYKGNFKDAGEQFKALIRKYPQGDHANDALIRVDVISLSGEDSTNLIYLSRFALAMKAQLFGKPFETATILSDSAFGGSPIAEQASFYAASAFASAGVRETAVDAFKRYIEKFSDGLYIDRAYLGLGDLYMQDAATYSSAKAAYDKILESFPNGPVTELARQRLLQLTAPGKIG